MTLTDDIVRLRERDLADPHRILGAHPTEDGVVVRAFRPDADAVTARVDGGEEVELKRVDDAGLFEGGVAGGALPLAYELEGPHWDPRYTLPHPYPSIPSRGEPHLSLPVRGRHAQLSP